jgi:uncharacterized protein (DUF849 family)
MIDHDNVIVTAALTGAIHVPRMSPHLPVTPEELIEQGIDAAEAGASIIHIHVRDPETGEPSSDVDLFREVASGIAAETDAIVQPTTGGSAAMSIEERVAVVPELAPETASCNMGSMNFGFYDILRAYDEDDFEHDWEPDYLEDSRDFIFANTFADIESLLETFHEHGTKPELECYDVGHLHTAKHFLDRGLLEPPLRIQFVMGIHGGIAAEPEHLTHMYQTAEKLFGDQYSFSVVAAGRKEFPLGTQAVSMGGHVRVGLEDNLYLERGKLAESNAQLVEKAVELTRSITGRDIASPAETREFLDLKGPEAVDF